MWKEKLLPEYFWIKETKFLNFLGDIFKTQSVIPLISGKEGEENPWRLKP